MKTENIKDCINIAGNAGHNIEHRRAKNELDEIININTALLEACKEALRQWHLSSTGAINTQAGEMLKEAITKAVEQE